jgi:hypothetical protein
MTSRNFRRTTEARGSTQLRSIRSWRETTKTVTDVALIFPERTTRRALRRERALSGQLGYDLNRHIRLAKQVHGEVGQEKTPPKWKAF